jgi:hypothetical protein
MACGEMIVSTTLAQKKQSCQYIEPSLHVSGVYPRLVHQSFSVMSVPSIATDIAIGGMSTMPTSNARLPMMQMLAPPSIRLVARQQIRTVKN